MLEPVQGYVSKSRDMSRGGIFVDTGMRFEVGQEVELRIEPPGGEQPFLIRSEVVRVVSPIGVALRFLDASPETLERLDSLLKAAGKQPTSDL